MDEPGGTRPPRPIVSALRARLPGDAIVCASEDDALDALLADLFMQAVGCVRSFGDFHLAIASDESLEPALVRLMIDPALRDLPWTRTRVWQADEQRDDPRGARMLREALAEHSGLPDDQLHTITEVSPAGAAAHESRLRECLGWRERGHDRLDVVLLALGERGRIAGLDEATAPGAGLVALVGDGQRVSMTLDLINAARFIAVLVPAGAGTRAARSIVAREPGSDSWPALRLRPLGGELRWYVGADALAPAGDGAVPGAGPHG